MRVSVVIPALNEEAAIGEVVREVPRDLVHEIIVVDNGSVDRTAALAIEAGAGKADLVIGSRVRGGAEPGALTPQQRAGNRIVTVLLRLLYGVPLTDIGPFRAIRASLLRDLAMEHKTYGWPVEMIVKAARRGYRIAEVPVTCRARRGRSKVAGTLKGSLLAGYHLLLTTVRFAWWR